MRSFLAALAASAGVLTMGYPLSFTSSTAWCDFYCGSYTIAQDIACATKCTAHRELKAVEPIDFITCQNTSSVQLPIESSGMSLKTFLHDFQEALDRMINGENPLLGACQLAYLTSSNTTIDQSNITPTLVKIERSDHEIDCIDPIKQTLTNDDAQAPFLRILSRSNGLDQGSTLLLVHANASQAEALSQLSCTYRVLPLPPLMKLGPFARSVSSVVSEAPAMEIGFLTPYSEQDVSAFNAELAQITGISNLLSSLSKKSMYMVPLVNFATWAKAVTFLCRKNNVLFLTSYASIRHYSESMPPIFRRLDAQAEIVVGVTEAQSNGIVGNNVTVGITDTGLYMDHDQFDQTGKRPYGTLALNNRKVVSYEVYGDKWDQSENVTCGHGTHVSGILLGSSYSKTQPNLGVAYNAKVAFMDIGTQSSACANMAGVVCPVSLQTPADVGDLVRNQVRAGANIFSYSWGTDGDDYSQQARDLDDYIFYNPETLIIVAAGNSGDEGSRSISSPAGAKNVISVGASMNTVASLQSTLDCPNIFNPNSVASFSSIGPTTDGRIKPDLVTPGQVLSSAQSLASGTTTKTTALCNLQGTSQATPVAAGLAVLIYEWLRDGWWKAGVYNPAFGLSNIPASLIKALMIHSSIGLKMRIGSLKGLVTCSYVEKTAKVLQYPDFNQGYGLPQFSNIASFGNSSTPKVFFLPNSTAGAPTIRHGDEHTYSFTVAPKQSFRVTLVWTDPPGSVAATVQLQNNLDLSVVVPGNASAIFYPISSPNGPDNLNNVEVVDVTYDALTKLVSVNSSDGGIVVQAKIKGKSILVTNYQEYSLVASSLAIQSSTPYPMGNTPTSGDSGSRTLDGQGNGTTAFQWQSWMTIVAASVGGVLVVVLLAVTFFRRKHQAPTGFARSATPRIINYQPSTIAQYAQPQDRCPFCAFQTRDPAVLVSHVQVMHPEV